MQLTLTPRTKTIADVLDDPEFWEKWEQRLKPQIADLFRDMFERGMAQAHEIVPIREKQLDAIVDADTINNATNAVLSTYTDAWWQQFSTTTQNQLRAAISDAVITGRIPDETAAAIADIFGPTRARRIAVTETTRFFGLGAQATFSAAGVGAWEWGTVFDDRVDAVCADLAGQQFSMEVAFQPAHVSCRCYPIPVLDRDFDQRQQAAVLAEDAAFFDFNLPPAMLQQVMDAQSALRSATTVVARSKALKQYARGVQTVYEHLGLPTNWNGSLVMSAPRGAAGVKRWECSIGVARSVMSRYTPSQLQHVVNHEMSHAMRGFTQAIYNSPGTAWAEEAATETFARAMTTRLSALTGQAEAGFGRVYQEAIDVFTAVARKQGLSAEQLAVRLKRVEVVTEEGAPQLIARLQTLFPGRDFMDANTLLQTGGFSPTMTSSKMENLIRKVNELEF